MKRTLHQAIEIVLTEKGVPMTTQEIANEINKRKLYTKGDSSALEPGQIAARCTNHPRTFVKVGISTYALQN